MPKIDSKIFSALPTSTTTTMAMNAEIMPPIDFAILGQEAMAAAAIASASRHSVSALDASTSSATGGGASPAGASPKPKGTKKSVQLSEVWNHYNMSSEGLSVTCKHCGRNMKRTDSSTKSMWGHLSSFHAAEVGQETFDRKRKRCVKPKRSADAIGTLFDYDISDSGTLDNNGLKKKRVKMAKRVNASASTANGSSGPQMSSHLNTTDELNDFKDANLANLLGSAQSFFSLPLASASTTIPNAAIFDLLKSAATYGAFDAPLSMSASSSQSGDEKIDVERHDDDGDEDNDNYEYDDEDGDATRAKVNRATNSLAESLAQTNFNPALLESFMHTMTKSGEMPPAGSFGDTSVTALSPDAMMLNYCAALLATAFGGATPPTHVIEAFYALLGSNCFPDFPVNTATATSSAPMTNSVSNPTDNATVKIGEGADIKVGEYLKKQLQQNTAKVINHNSQQQQQQQQKAQLSNGWAKNESTESALTQAALATALASFAPQSLDSQPTYQQYYERNNKEEVKPRKSCLTKGAKPVTSKASVGVEDDAPSSDEDGTRSYASGDIAQHATHTTQQNAESGVGSAASSGTSRPSSSSPPLVASSTATAGAMELPKVSTSSGVVSLQSAESLYAMHQIAMDLNLVYQTRRGEDGSPQFDFRPNTAASWNGDNTKHVTLTETAEKMLITEHMPQTDVGANASAQIHATTEAWLKSTVAQLMWAVRGKCQKCFCAK